MKEQTHRRLQLAVDVFNIQEALDIVDQVYPSVDIVELGTPLILSEGLRVVEEIKSRFPDREYLVDLKLMDGGYNISAAAFARGADIVTVLAQADDETISRAMDAARERNKSVMVDMMNEDHLVARAREVEALGVSMICVHTPYDRHSAELDALRDLAAIRPVRQMLARDRGRYQNGARPPGGRVGCRHHRCRRRNYLVQGPTPDRTRNARDHPRGGDLRQTKETIERMIVALSQTLARVDADRIEAAIVDLRDADRVFIAGRAEAGRS